MAGLNSRREQYELTSAGTHAIDEMNLEPVSLNTLFRGLNTDEKFSSYRDLWHRAARYEVLTDFPLHLDIELSGKCNLKCESCFQNGLIRSELGSMKRDLFENIIEEGIRRGLCAIKLQIRGESFLHPELFDFIRLAKRKGVADTQITTNGTLLTNEKMYQTFESGLDGIIFSIDSHHESSSAKRRAGESTSVEGIITRFLEKRERLGQRKPWVRIQSAISDAAEGSLARAEDFLRRKFPLADSFAGSRLYDFRDDEDSMPDLPTNYKFLPCSYLMQRLAIFWDGAVTTCCMDYNGKLSLGHVSESSIQDIWLSEKMQSFRRTHLSGGRDAMPVCRHCHNCISKHKNIPAAKSVREHNIESLKGTVALR